MKTLTAFNTWYDNLPEPYRFLTFFIPMLTAIVLINIKATILYGFFGFSVIGMVAAQRAYKMGGADRTIGILLFAFTFLLFLASLGALLLSLLTSP